MGEVSMPQQRSLSKIESSRVQEGVRLPTSTSARRKTLSDVLGRPAPICHISTKDRQRSRSLEHIKNLDSVMTSSDGIAEDLLLVWRLARIITTSQLLDSPPEAETILPGFSAFCADLHPHREASTIAYLLLSQHLQLIHLSSKKR